MKLGLYVYGLAALAVGVIDLAWGGFESVHQPIQAFGDHVPGQHAFALVVSALLVAGGAAVLFRRSERFGAMALGLSYAVFAVFWLPRLFTAPRVLGYHASVYIAVLGGVCEQLVVVAAALLVYAHASGPSWRPAQRATSIARWVFGLSAVDFGLAQLTGVAMTASLVPKWMPLGQDFWAVFTGVAFVLAGIAILAKFVDVLAARLTALMLVVFSALALTPIVIAYPHAQAAWGGNAYNLVAAASMWIFASWIAACRPAGQAERSRVPAT